MVLNLLPSKDNLSKNTEQVFTLWSFSALLGFFWFEDSLSQDCEQVEETHTEDATPETDHSDENWLKNEIESHSVLKTEHYALTHMEIHTTEEWFCLLKLLRGVISVHGLVWALRCEEEEEEGDGGEEISHDGVLWL